MKHYHSWKIAFFILLTITLSMALGISTYKLYGSTDSEKKIIKHEIFISSKDSAKIIFDSIMALKLENYIQQVEKKNDGRFEVLTWATVLIITLLAGFVTVNFIISSSRVKEIVDDKINEKTRDIQDKISAKYEEISQISIDAEKIKNTLQSSLTASLSHTND